MIETQGSNGEKRAEHLCPCCLIASKPRTISRPVTCSSKHVPSQNEPLLSCRIQSSRYRKALVFHNHILEINEDPEQLQCHYEMRDLLVAVVWRLSKGRASKSENIAGAKMLGTTHFLRSFPPLQALENMGLIWSRSLIQFGMLFYLVLGYHSLY